MKKILITILLTIMISSHFTFAEENKKTDFSQPKSSSTFSDLADNHWAKSSIDKLVGLGLMTGYIDNTIKPEGNITRAEFVVLINSMMKYKDQVDQSKFNDISSSAWYYPHMLIAEKQNYIAGFKDGSFRPNANITKEQVCVIISNVMKLEELPAFQAPADKVSEWAKPSVNKILSNRIMTLDEKGNFNGLSLATRAQVADAVAKFLTDKTQVQIQTIPVNMNPSVTINPSSSGGGGGGTPSDPAITQQQVNASVSNLINTLKTRVISNSNITTEAQKNVINNMISNLEMYLSDNTININVMADNIKQQYHSLSEKEREGLKTAITTHVYLDDVSTLRKFFNL